MRVYFKLCVLAVVVSMPSVLARQSGAPTSACTSMRPGHRFNGTLIEPQEPDQSPYSIVLSSSEYSPGETITVTIQGGDYRGVLLQVRKVGEDTPTGTWSNPPNDTKLLTCTNSNDAVTHANTNLKGEDSVYTWTSSENVGAVQIVATIAESYNVFWVQLVSDQVSGAVQGASPNILLLLLVALFVFLGE
ncbi:putative defense protein 3 [Ptychodera flava]|uniref:putative defense protein 3 n=1 Tax=Ptychodera flava TaxID=63121 RepID=UPI00396A32DE